MCKKKKKNEELEFTKVTAKKIVTETKAERYTSYRSNDKIVLQLKISEEDCCLSCCIVLPTMCTECLGSPQDNVMCSVGRLECY